MRGSLVLFGIISLAQFACQHSGGMPGQPLDDKPTGEIRLRGGSASFNATRVFGPKVNVTRRSDGSWGGTLFDHALDVSVRGNTISGAYEKLYIEELPNGVNIDGLWREQMIHFVVSKDQFLVNTPMLSFSVYRTADGVYGAREDVKLIGEAANLHPPMPQFALALVAACGYANAPIVRPDQRY